MNGGICQMGRVYSMEEIKTSEQSKKEICDACMDMAKTHLNFTEKQLKQFEKDFYTVADKYIFGAKKKK